MGREIKRVPLDFTWPLRREWEGFETPDRLQLADCPTCQGRGWSPHAEHLHDLWYGNVPFDPTSTGLAPLTADTPAVRAFAERNVARSPGFYGTDERAIVQESRRLAALWNGQWSHHLHQDDVDALVAADRLTDLTHEWTPDHGWRAKSPPVRPTATEVNTWSLLGFGHDAINAMIVIDARCAREGVPSRCETCGGSGGIEQWPGQKAERDAWKPSEPPTGEGWQLWETFTLGSPVSPVFPDAEQLAAWLTTTAGADALGSKEPMTLEQARGFIQAGWAPTLIGNVGGMHRGPEFVGSEHVLRQLADGAGEES